MADKLVLAEPVQHDGTDYAPGDSVPPDVAKALPEGYVVKESEYKKLVAESDDSGDDDGDGDDGA